MSRDLWDEARRKAEAGNGRRHGSPARNLGKVAAKSNAKFDAKYGPARVVAPSPRWRRGPLGSGLPLVMWFGRHRGKPIADIPASYLDLLLTLPDLDDRIRSAIGIYRAPF